MCALGYLPAHGPCFAVRPMHCDPLSSHYFPPLPKHKHARENFSGMDKTMTIFSLTCSTRFFLFSFIYNYLYSCHFNNK
jgi:hypothetical protein